MKIKRKQATKLKIAPLPPLPFLPPSLSPLPPLPFLFPFLFIHKTFFLYSITPLNRPTFLAHQFRTFFF